MKSVSLHLSLLVLLLSIGVVLRFLIASIGFNFDMQSYEIVAKIVSNGGNVYNETTRYNYGPIWFILLGIAYKISSVFPDQFLAFRFLIVGTLTLVDIGICLLLVKRYSLKVGVLFFLCPISIIITGYYSQFDNFSFLLGFIAVLLLERSRKEKIDTYLIASACLLGLSLMLKHIFFLFPVWLFISQKKITKKTFILVVPLLIFGIGFLPFLVEGFQGIKNNVFLYKSFNNAPLWQQIVPDNIKLLLKKEYLFIGSLILGGILFYRKKPVEQLLYYSAFLVTFSSAIADQYFAIILPFISVFFNVFFAVFIVLQTLFSLMVINGGEVIWLGYFIDRSNFNYTFQLLFIFMGLLYVLYRNYFSVFRFRHITIILISLVGIVYGFILIPSYIEDQKIKPIESAIKEGNYELANDLYVLIEKKPPFAGSRYYEKLQFVRINLEYYRKYRYALDGFMDHSLERNWKQVIKDLTPMPIHFTEKENVDKILKFARKNYEIN